MENLLLLFLLAISCVLLLETSQRRGIVPNWVTLKASDGARDAALLSYFALHEEVNASALDLRRGEGGNLWISASYGDAFRPDEKFIALTEAPRDFNTSAFKPPFPYEYVYCSSPLYGNLSPQQICEWMAYHNHLFGERAYFILYNGGVSLVHVMEVNKQANVSKIQLEPSKMHWGACLQDPHGGGVDNHTWDDVNAKKWMMEKLVFAWKYRWPIVYDKKYAIQSRSCWAKRVHKCELLIDGGHMHVMDEAQFRFYHYHDTLATCVEVCTEFSITHYLVKGEDSYYIDDTMVGMVDVVREYEQQTIGAQPFIL